jgi:hypothetical protein
VDVVSNLFCHPFVVFVHEEVHYWECPMGSAIRSGGSLLFHCMKKGFTLCMMQFAKVVGKGPGRLAWHEKIDALMKGDQAKRFDRDGGVLPFFGCCPHGGDTVRSDACRRGDIVHVLSKNLSFPDIME